MMIRAAQFDQIQASRDRAFAGTLIRQFRIDYPERHGVLSRQDVQPRVVSLLRKARGYGFTQDRDLRAFVALTLFLADPWDEHPACNRVLQDQTAEPTARLQHLLHNWTAADWDRVRLWCEGGRQQQTAAHA